MNYFKKLSLYNFRNYKQTQICFEKSPIVLFGLNGSGKTNLLEALSFFSVGTGLRNATLPDIAYQNEQEKSLSWAVQAELNEDIVLSTGGQFIENGRMRRICKIQGVNVKSAASFHDYTNIVHITPDMDHIFTNASCERRRFIDRLIASYNPLYSASISAYEKATKERLSLLKKEESPDPLWLDALEKIMAQNNVKIAKARRDLMNRLMEGQNNHIPLFPQFFCKMQGKIEDFLENYSDNVCLKIQEELKKNRPLDRAAGMTILGCHRSDFEVSHKKHQRLAKECSTGEQKIILISIILAFVYKKIENSETFLTLLLDDVIARLDFNHRMVLFEQVDHLNYKTEARNSVQTFFSGTDLNLFESMKNAQFFEIHQASITPR